MEIEAYAASGRTNDHGHHQKESEECCHGLVRKVDRKVSDIFAPLSTVRQRGKEAKRQRGQEPRGKVQQAGRSKDTMFMDDHHEKHWTMDMASG